MSLTNNYTKQSFSFGDGGISPNDTFLSLFGKPKNRDEFLQITHDSRYKLLHEKYKEIFKAGDESGLKTAETQILIHQYTDGVPLNEIEYRRLDDIKIFVIANAKNLLSLINPKLHAFLLRTRYFSKDRNEQPKPYRLQRVSRIIKNLMGKTNSKEKLLKFSEIISKL